MLVIDAIGEAVASNRVASALKKLKLAPSKRALAASPASQSSNSVGAARGDRRGCPTTNFIPSVLHHQTPPIAIMVCTGAQERADSRRASLQKRDDQVLAVSVAVDCRNLCPQSKTKSKAARIPVPKDTPANLTTQALPIDAKNYQACQIQRRQYQQGPDLALHASERVKRVRLSYAKPSSTTEEAPESSNPIAHWVTEGQWPEELQNLDPKMQRRILGSVGSADSSDERLRDERSLSYSDIRYNKRLEEQGAFMCSSPLGITQESKSLCQTLFTHQQPPPLHSLFSDDTFEMGCRKAAGRNEARVKQDIRPELIPSVERLATDGARHLECLIESTDEAWNNCIPLTSKRPQPDYAVGFQSNAFTPSQLDKISPYIGDYIAGDASHFMATYLMYFPFLTCEVQCGAAALDVADRQNAHSATIAARGVVELYRLVNRERELDRQILAFSFSHDHQNIRIYGHYPDFKDGEPKYFRHKIRSFDFTELDGREKWTTRTFVLNALEKWMPQHLQRICSVIDELPSHLSCKVSSLPESDLSQHLEDYHSNPSDVVSLNELNNRDRQEPTPETSFTGSGVKRVRLKNDKNG